jgi:hypothetical protein
VHDVENADVPFSVRPQGLEPRTRGLRVPPKSGHPVSARVVQGFSLRFGAAPKNTDDGPFVIMTARSFARRLQRGETLGSARALALDRARRTPMSQLAVDGALPDARL